MKLLRLNTFWGELLKSILSLLSGIRMFRLSIYEIKVIIINILKYTINPYFMLLCKDLKKIVSFFSSNVITLIFGFIF